MISETEHDPDHPVAPRRSQRGSFWKELPILVVVAFVVALLVKTFVLQAFFIPSASMLPTLREGDRVIVEKIGYRIGEPERGDVVVFERDLPVLGGPAEDQPFWTDIIDAFRGLFGFPTGGTQDFIKRVVGVGGDTLQGFEGRLLVNGEPLDEPYLTEGTTTGDFGPTQVPEGMIFVMGDNRENSDDSRSFGPIPVDTVIGHAFLLVWPPSEFALL